MDTYMVRYARLDDRTKKGKLKFKHVMFFGHTTADVVKELKEFILVSDKKINFSSYRFSIFKMVKYVKTRKLWRRS